MVISHQMARHRRNVGQQIAGDPGQVSDIGAAWRNGHSWPRDTSLPIRQCPRAKVCGGQVGYACEGAVRVPAEPGRQLVRCWLPFRNGPFPPATLLWRAHRQEWRLRPWPLI
jgi:hypothetical protein